MKNFYQILNIGPDATPEQIENVYEYFLEMREKYPASFTEQIASDIDEAYVTLSNPEIRKEYDRRLHKHLALQDDDIGFLHGPRHTRKSASVEIFDACGGRLAKYMVLYFALITLLGFLWVALEYIPENTALDGQEDNTPALTPTPSPTIPILRQASPRPGQRCMFRSKINQAVKLLADRAENALVLGTIDAGTTFRGIWHQEWIEVDMPVSGLPAHGFVHQEDIAVISCS